MPEIIEHQVGDIVTLDRIESVIIYRASEAQDWGKYILADKNHDLCWYFLGDDFIDDGYWGPGKWGYEWGGYNIVAGTTSYEIGYGLSQTNTLISLDLPLFNSANELLWDKVVEFRNSHSDKWFIPTVNELKELFKSVKLFNNLSVVTYTGYWTTTEYDSQIAKNVYLNSGQDSTITKNTMYERARMFRYATDFDFNPVTLQIDCATLNSQIYYTTDGLDPSENSTLYQNNFLISEETVIKAKAYKEGWVDSDISTFEIT